MNCYLMHAVLDGWACGLKDFESAKSKNIHETFVYEDGGEMHDAGVDVVDYENCVGLLQHEGYIASFGLTIKGHDLLKIFRFAIDCDKVEFYDFESLLFCDAVEYFSKEMRRSYMGREIMQIATTDETVFVLDSEGLLWHKNFNMRDFEGIESKKFNS